LWDETSQSLVPRVWTSGAPAAWASGLAIKPGEGLVGQVAERRVGAFVNDYPSWPHAHPTFRAEMHALLAEPLMYRSELVGAFAVFHRDPGREFSEGDRSLLTLLAAQTAVAIENARLFTKMTQAFEDSQKAHSALLRTEKLRALGQMSGGIAHDLNNMLAVILGQIELLRFRVQLPEVHEALLQLETAASDGASIVRRLQDFSRQRAAAPLVPVDLARVVQETIDITRPRWKDDAQMRGREIEIHVAIDGLPPILGLASDIREALTNLIFNAVDAMPQGGLLSFSGQCHRDTVALQVTDTGIGMPEEVRQNIFEPGSDSPSRTASWSGMAGGSRCSPRPDMAQPSRCIFFRHQAA